MATDNIDAIHDTFKEEIIKEELTEIKWSSENGVYKESPQMVGRDEKFHDLDSSNYKKNSRESKPSLTHFWKTPNFDTENIFAADDREVDKIEKNIKVDNAYEDHPEFIDDLSSFNAELKTQTLKSEDEIDIAYEDIKPEIDGNKLSGNKSHPNNIANIVPQESATDFCKNSNFDTEYIFAADDQEVDKIEKNIKVENAYEDHPEFIDDLSSINAELKTQTLKSEDDIDIVYEDIKPEMDGNKLSGNKPHPNNIANIVSQESAIGLFSHTSHFIKFFYFQPTLLKRKKKPFENISKPKAQQKLFNITSTQQEVLRDKIVECENKDACIKDLTQQLEEIKDEMSQLRSQRGHLQLEKTKYEQTIKNTNTKHKNDLESVNHVFKGIMREVNEKKQGLTQQLLFLRNEYENFMKENLKQMMELKDNCDKFPLLLKESSEEYIRLIGIKEAQLENKEKELKAFEGSCIEMQNQHYLEIEKMKKEHHLEVQDIEFELLKNMSELQREKELSLNKIRTMEDKLQEQIFEIKKIFENERKQLILESKRELKEVKQHFKDSNLITEIELKEKLNEVETDWRNKLTIQEKEAEAILKECQAISEYSIIQCEIEKNKIKTDLQQTTDHLNNIESKYANVMKLYEDILIKYEDSQAKLNKFVNKLNQIENHFHGVLQEKNVEIDQLAKEKSTYQITMKNSQATVEVLKKRLINSDRDVEQLKKEITDCEGKILEYEQKCLQLTSELKQAQTFNDELEMQYESSIKLNRTDIDNMGLKLLEKVDDYQREVETYSKKIEYERKLKKEIMQQLHDAYDMINRLKLDLENIEMLHSQYKFELEQSQNELEDYHMREMDWNIIRDKLEHTIEELEEILEAKHLEIDELKKKIVHLEEKNNSYSQYSDYYQKKLQEYEDEQIETGNIHKKYIEISGKYDQLSQKLEEMEIKQLQHQCEVENLEKEAAEAGHWKEQYHKQKKDYDELSEKNDTLRKQMRNNKKHDDEPTTKLQLEKLMANRDFLLSKVEYLENKLKEECQKNADLAEHQNNNHLVGLRVKNEELVQSNIDLETKLQTAQRTIEKLKKENDLKKVMKKNKVSKEDKENFGSPNRSLNSSRIESPFRNRN